MFDFFKNILIPQIMETPRVEYEPLNGRVMNNLIIPDDIIMNILGYVNGKDILLCRLVCKNWDEFVVSTINYLYRKRFHKPPEKLPLRYLFIRLYRNMFQRNLLTNVNGELGFNNWKVVANGGDRFVIERIPQGAPLLPEKVPEFNGRTSCFATSYRPCEKMQTIPVLKNSDLDYVLRHKVKVYASEWVCARFDCAAKYRMKVALHSKNGDVKETTAVYSEEQWAYASWKKVELEIDDYPDDIDSIHFIHLGQDRQFWAGHYGMKMAGAVLKLVPID